jgi:hypothetical protein
VDWQRSAVEAAATYLREVIDAGGDDYRTRTLHEGLLDVLDPARHAARIERAASADVSAMLMAVRGERRRRIDIDRRGRSDRRLVNFGPAAFGERRTGQDRRNTIDRRSR